MKQLLVVVFSIWVFALHSCMFTEENLQDNVVQLEDLIYLSSNKVRLLARVVENNESINDHGFYLASDEEFNDPIIKSLGSKNTTGLYYSEIDSLSQTSDYYYKAYFSTSDNIYFSESKSFSTFEGVINNVSRTIGKDGEITKITGRNLTNDLSIKFGTTPAEITDRFGDYEVWVKVPKVQQGYKQPIIATMEGISYAVDTFYYETGKWTQLSNMNNPPFFKGVTFLNTHTAAISMGVHKDGTPNTQMYSLDLTTFQWTQTTIPSSIIPVEGAFSTPSGYFGSGSSEQVAMGQYLVYQLENGFYKYENGSYTTLPSTPFVSYASFAAEHNDIVYVLGGRDALYQPLKLFYKFENGVWTNMGELPFEYDTSTPSFNLGSEILLTNNNEEVWSFDFQTESFIRKTDFPTKISQEGIAQVVDNQLVYGLFILSNLVNSTDFLGELQLEKITFPGDRNFKNISHFKKNSAIYIVRGSTEDNANEMEFWKFEPFEFNN